MLDTLKREHQEPEMPTENSEPSSQKRKWRKVDEAANNIHSPAANSSCFSSSFVSSADIVPISPTKIQETIFTAPVSLGNQKVKPTPNRPPLLEDLKPKIWSRSRQELCESFQWFRSYQGGVYHSGGIVKGYLLGGYASSRDIFYDDGRLIISHGGGKSEGVLHRKAGLHLSQATDQLEQDHSVRALMNTYKQGRPLVLIIDDRYEKFPYDLKDTEIGYAVLGWYHIVHFWAERQRLEHGEGDVVRYKFAFQYFSAQGPRWWLREDPNMPLVEAKQEGRRVKINSLQQDLRLVKPVASDSNVECESCGKTSPRVYAIRWTCLNSHCESFWRLPEASEQLDYHSSLLMPVPAKCAPSEKLFPLPPITSGNTTSFSSSRGWHCTKCGRLSCRLRWDRLECQNTECSVSIDVDLDIKRRQHLLTPVKFDYMILDKKEVVSLRSSRIDFDDSCIFLQTFRLNKGGKIHHLRYRAFRDQTIPDEIFKLYQEQASSGAIPFRRHPLKTHKLKGIMLANYFSQNCGVPYQYAAGDGDTIPFDSPETPSAVSMARDFLQERVSKALETPVEFNEVLSAAYMEKQKMSFHADNERGLGHLVAGLSLGSPAYMHFRRSLSGCKTKQKEGHDSKVIVTFTLMHGDILVMDGTEVQENYEHTAVPMGFRIAATARSIKPNHHEPSASAIRRVNKTSQNCSVPAQ